MGAFIIGFVACLGLYACLVGVLSVIQYKKKKKERINAQQEKGEKEA